MLFRPTLPFHLVLACFCFLAPVSSSGVNVLLVTVDTFRPDHLGAYGYDRDTSPSLDSLAADGAVFEQTISSSSWTTPSLISVLTGQWAPAHGVDVRGKSLRPGTPTFGTELGRAGYATPDILYLSSIPNLQNIGLTKSYTDRDKYLPEGDEVLFKALEAYQDSLFFIYYHYRNLHLPIRPAEPYDTMFTPAEYARDGFVKDRVEVVRENVTIPLGTITFARKDSGWIRGLYDGQIREMDETFFRPLVRQLKDLGLYERTLVIVTADHGEELLERGFIGHPSTSFKGSAYDELLRIPLVMTCPDLIPAGTRVPTQVQNVDIFPTVLDLLDLPTPPSVQGRSLVGALRGDPIDHLPAFTETTQGGYQSTPEMMKVRVRAHRDPPWKLIHSLGPGLDKTELFDLEKDPAEVNDLARARPEIADRMRKDLHAWLLTVKQAPRSEIAADRPAHTGQIRVRFPAHGDTLRYAAADKTVDVQWQGTEAAAYAIEYRVGVGNYHLEGRIPVDGLVSRHGPFTEEMWNMLSLYNPFVFRVVADGSNSASDWVTFVIEPSGGAPASTLDVMLAKSIWIAAEAGYLLAGIWTVLVLLLEIARSYVLSDFLGSGLVGSLIVAGIWPSVIRRFGAEHTKLWGIVAVYTGFIYATLSVAPELWGTLFRMTQGRINYVVPVIAAGFAVWVPFRIASLRLGIAAVFSTIGIAVVYVSLLTWLSQSPAERFHLAEYGLLSLLTYRASRLDRDHGKAVVFGFIVAFVLGTGDEMIQWSLPTRVFEWKDIWLNVLSSGLGMALVVTLNSSGRRVSA
jgi:arylsulfatase A-like enzyme/VanZ family protein